MYGSFDVCVFSLFEDIRVTLFISRYIWFKPTQGEDNRGGLKLIRDSGDTDAKVVSQEQGPLELAPSGPGALVPFSPTLGSAPAEKLAIAAVPVFY